ncbi:uncharacterized protein GGS22DRAFT_196036 [Annulohypoxylon maeteangense]|uniref:uncharacterized protein n=1 Tax=Annulohypoxylon maeteangense TaxID=1927788 RepID=UPI002007F9E5|nr:uncharacterized protein GGS22DRAFT_196036 [Annulohypoxylon maeteangense]KAI0882337.1 hypothetical protein GGS22DRAFT_196036 [Annulohypoxylon maeteangense]
MATLKRFIANADETFRTVDANKELLASLYRITTHYPPVHTCSTGWKFEGFYNGPTSIAYLFYRLSQIFPDMEFKQQSLLDWAEAYLALGARRTKKDPSPNNCGITNETLAHLSLTAVMKRDINIVRQICSFAAYVNNLQLTSSDEWMYGRAGYLYFLRLCETLIKETQNPESSTATLLDKTVDNTITRILANPPPHYWHGKDYHGAAHGTIGMITQLVLTRPSIAVALHLMLELVLIRQFASGNFPATEGSHVDFLVQFCHGAPGINIALRSLLPHFSEKVRAKMEAAMKSADEEVWRRGLLSKNPCLCHGIPGNALALTEGGQERLLHFLSWMGTEELESRGWLAQEARDGEAAGLFTGEAGRAWVWGVVAGGWPRVLIGFNDI